jgi:phenylalanyl-tRNA synthetase beta chain
MRVPLSWLKDYVDIPISAELLAERLTLAGLEVASIDYVGVEQGEAPAGINVPPSGHLVWTRDKIVLGAIKEVKAHPNADKLVLAMVDYGAPQLEQVVTGAPNLYPYKDIGPLDPPLFTALALEGAEVFDGHADGQKRMILKEKALRGIPNRSMVCSAKELGLSEEHDGIILMADPRQKPGTPFADVLGDVIFDIELTPNLARCYSILGVAREVAALTGGAVREPSYAGTGQRRD